MVPGLVDGASQVVEETFLLLQLDSAGLELVLLPPGKTGRTSVPHWTGLTKVLQVQQLLRNLLRRQLRLRLRLPVERTGGSDGSPPVLTGQPVGREGGGERGRGGEGGHEGLVVEPAAGPLHRLLALAAQADGVEDEAWTAGLPPGSPGDAEVELVAVLGVGVTGVLVGGAGRAGELVERTGGTAGSKQFLVITWHRQHRNTAGPALSSQLTSRSGQRSRTALCWGRR